MDVGGQALHLDPQGRRTRNGGVAVPQRLRKERRKLAEILAVGIVLREIQPKEIIHLKGPRLAALANRRHGVLVLRESPLHQHHVSLRKLLQKVPVNAIEPAQTKRRIGLEVLHHPQMGAVAGRMIVGADQDAEHRAHRGDHDVHELACAAQRTVCQCGLRGLEGGAGRRSRLLTVHEVHQRPPGQFRIIF